MYELTVDSVLFMLALIISSFSILCVVGAIRHSLQDKLSKGSTGRSHDEIYLKLRTSTGWPLIL
jgi:dynamin GTPase